MQKYVSIKPKLKKYFNNGSGRDTYIQNYLCLKTKPLKSFRIVNKSQKSYKKSFHKTVKYKPDGSGRDSYISYNDGGLHSPKLQKNTVSSHVLFKSILRGKENVLKKKFTIQKSNKDLLKEKLLAKSVFKKQRATSARLSKPKIFPLQKNLLVSSKLKKNILVSSKLKKTLSLMRKGKKRFLILNK